MKKYILIPLFVFATISMFAQLGVTKLPSVDLKTPQGKTVNSMLLNNNGKPMVISFWATWCKPCITELSNIDELYSDWVDETGVKLIAISIDDARSAARVAPFVNGKAWEYEVYIDANSDFKRALNVLNVPHTFLLDADGVVVWQHASYVEGDEYELFEMIKKVARGEKLNAD